MQIQDYQPLAARTLLETPDQPLTEEELKIIWHAIEITAKAGLITEAVKKGIFHRHGLNQPDIRQQIAELYNVINRFNHALNGRDFIKTEKLPRLDDNKTMLLWNLIGLVGEAGEVAGLVLSNLKTGELNDKKIGLELGDLTWYIAAICTKVRLKFTDILGWNIDKLKARYPEGYQSERSQNRDSK